MLIEKVLENVERSIHLSPCHANRSSELGHPCDRHLYFRRTRWEEATKPSVSLQLLFNEGHLQEKATLRALEDAGWTLIEQQRDVEWKQYNITGHLDAKILIDGAAYPLEVKSMSPYVFKTVSDAEDLKYSKFPHLRRYVAQLQLYMLLSNSTRAVFILKDKASGQLKELWLELDLEYAESLVQKAQRINAYVDRQETPPPIPYDEKICGSCAFLHICLPEMKRDALDLITDPELEEKLKRRDELAPLRSEYEKLDDEVKRTVSHHDKIMVGDFLIQTKVVEKKMPATPERTMQYRQTKIARLIPSHEVQE